MNTPYFSDDSVTLWHGDSLDVVSELPEQSVDCVVTSPPYYGLRDYGVEGQYGLEESPAEYVETLRSLFRQIRRVLADDGTLWLNIGDSYSGSGKGAAGNEEARAISLANGKAVYVPTRDEIKHAGKTYEGLPAKNLLGIPWRVAFALQDDGWILRNDIIWAKPNAMPESVTDRLSTKHEHLFLFAKRSRYWFDLDPIREPLARPDVDGSTWVFGGANKAEHTGRQLTKVYTPDERGRNPGDVWSIPTQPYPGAHFAVMPQTLASRCIQAGCKPGGTVLDPFSGSGTTGLAAARHGRKYVGIDLNSDYLDLSLKTRLAQPALMDDLA